MTQSALEFLRNERSKLDAAIKLLEGEGGPTHGTTSGGTPTDPSTSKTSKRRRGQRTFTEAQKIAQGKRMKAMWKARKRDTAAAKAGKKSAKKVKAATTAE